MARIHGLDGTTSSLPHNWAASPPLRNQRCPAVGVFNRAEPSQCQLLTVRSTTVQDRRPGDPELAPAVSPRGSAACPLPAILSKQSWQMMLALVGLR
jgi:hypothetical protein